MDEATRHDAFESHVVRGPHGAHEASDVAVVSITKFGVIIAATTLAAMMLMWFVLEFMTGYEVAQSPQAPPMSRSNPMTMPPAPNLQGSPIPDLQQFRAAEDQKLSSYSLVDKDKKVYQIPVERALELTVQSGKLPEFPASTAINPAAANRPAAQGGARQ